MSLSAHQIAFARELFDGISDLSTRKMFGGLGLYSDGVIFALMRSDGQILLKAQNNGFAAELSELGAVKWTYTRKSGVESAMPYWSLPDAALDDPALAQRLAKQALLLLR